MSPMTFETADSCKTSFPVNSDNTQYTKGCKQKINRKPSKMDIKSMAKSKRSHTKHNQPKKPHQQHNNSPKPTSSITTNPSNSNKEVKEKKNKGVPQKPPSLPSNWDRYDDEGDAEVGLIEPGSKNDDQGVVPKSKGADFRDLIAQAKESKQQFRLSFGDSIDDFYQGLAPMLDVKSEGIPSWVRDDDFLLENEATTSEEGPNFSLDLKALAEELAKADLAKRLFIEPDLLPPELRGVDANEVDHQVAEKQIKLETFQDLYSIYLADEKVAQTEDSNDKRVLSSGDMRDVKVRDTPHPIRMTELVRDHSIQKFSDFDTREVPPADHVIKQDTQPSSIFADVSEGELDMLPDSFSETKFSNSTNTSMSQPATSKSNLAGNSVTHKSPFPHTQDASKPAEITNSLDDELDILLSATNLNMNVGREAPLQHSLDPSRPIVPISSCSPDDELDNLLEETFKPSKVKIDSSTFPSASTLTLPPSSKSEVFEDFDSWLDTL